MAAPMAQNSAASTPIPARPGWLGYGIAMIAVAVATLLRLLLDPLLGGHAAFTLYFLAVLFIAWYWGLRPALLTAVLGTGLGWYYFVSPSRSFTVKDPLAWIDVGIFFCITVTISVLTETQRQAQRLADAKAHEAQDRALALRESREQLATTLRSIGDAVIATDVTGRITFMNAVAERLTGWSEVEARDKPIDAVFRIVDEVTRQPAESPVAQVSAQDRIVGLTHHTLLIARDNRERLIEASSAPIQVGGDPLLGVVLVFRDVTEQRREEAARNFLTEATEVLASSLDYEQTLQKVAQLAVPHIADWCGVDMWAPDGTIQLLAVAHVDPEKVKWARELRRRRPMDPDDPGGLAQVLRTGQPVLLPAHLEKQILASIEDAELREIVRQIGFEAVIIVPILARERILGAITLITTHESGRHYAAADLELAEGLAARAALAIDNAGLYRAAQQEIVERRKTEQEIEALNRRLQRSMRETHHRVKNNLQVITSLLSMQRLQYGDQIPVSELQRVTQHIQALATIHDLLTQQARTDSEVTDLSLPDVMERLVPTLQGLVDGRHIRYTVEDMRLPVRQTSTLAVLINELISNAVKHGAGDIDLVLTVRDGLAHLTVQDKGSGFPEGFSADTAAHTGLELIESLSKWDLQGSVAYANGADGGARVVVEFPMPGRAQSAGETPVSTD